MQGIYEIVNLCDGRATAYVGSSVNITVRWRRHRNELVAGVHANGHLQCAWDKYGEEAFAFSVLEEVQGNELLEIEQEYLDAYFDSGSCYNIARDARAPGRGRTPSKEQRRKTSESLKGKKKPPFTEEHRRNLSKAHMGHIPWNKGKKGQVAWNKGKVGISEDTRCKLRESHLGHNKGVPPSPECLRKAIEARVKYYPAFIYQRTGEIIPAGYNLSKLCRERDLGRAHMWAVIHGKRKSHKGWRLLKTGNITQLDREPLNI